jgi:hypothetical protein
MSAATIAINISAGFHNAVAITVRAKVDPRGGIKLSTGQAARINRHMCGVKGCICGMHHGWLIDGASTNDLSEAMAEANYANVNNSYRNAR